jgi:hypothetical protein
MEHLIITSIAGQDHPVLKRYAEESAARQTSFVVIGDLKSPEMFELEGCDFYSIERQRALPLSIAKLLPCNHYARKNIGYLAAILSGAEIIIETDDDNLPLPGFWAERERLVIAHNITHSGWVNVYKYFTDRNVWPRGFSLEHIQDVVPLVDEQQILDCPIQQGLATINPDVDALFRLTQPLPVEFKQYGNLALGRNSVCPFNSQNTTWFKDAFPLLYLPSYCSFRMTDIWRSFVAQRIAWECDWSILFHNSTVWQERNDHNLLNDFKDEIIGYLHNNTIVNELKKLKLKKGKSHIPENLFVCYQKLIDLQLIKPEETVLIKAWIDDLADITIS